MRHVITWEKVRYHWEIYLFVLPAVVLIALFQYYPAASGVYHSFFHWNGADISEFVATFNYRDLWDNQQFWKSFQVAFLLGGFNVLKMAPALAVAVCIHRCRSVRMQFLYRALFVVPMVVPALIVALVWRTCFFEPTTGYLNRFLNSTGLINALAWLDRTLHWGGAFSPDHPSSWVGDPRLVLVACIIWGFPWVGSFEVLTHLARLQGINKDIYEAAEVDGANWFTKFTRIELPLITSSIYLLLVFVIIGTIKDAGTILVLTGVEGGPGGRATVPALFMMRKAFNEQNMGYACAIGVMLTLVIMGLQKLCVFVIGWNSHPARHRLGFRVAVAAAAVTVIAKGNPTHFWVGLLALTAVAALAGGTFTTWRGRLRRQLMPDDDSATPAPGALTFHPLARRDDPRSKWRRQLGDLLLRVGKHAFVCTILLFAFLPFYLMFVVSLKTNTQFYNAPSIPAAPFHWENWSTAWMTVNPAVANSLFVSIVGTFVTLCCAITAAYFFARYQMPLSGFLWNAILILMMMPTIANLVPLFRLMTSLDLVNTLFGLMIVGVSAGQVTAIFVLRSFVQDIPHDLFEAAEMDGANHFQQMMTVVLPLSGPILGTVGIMAFIHLWNEFILPLVVMRDQSRLPVMVRLLYLSGEYITHFGPLMAGYVLASLPVVILFIFSMKLFVKGLTEGSVKG